MSLSFAFTYPPFCRLGFTAAATRHKKKAGARIPANSRHAHKTKIYAIVLGKVFYVNAPLPVNVNVPCAKLPVGYSASTSFRSAVPVTMFVCEPLSCIVMLNI